MEQSNRSIRDSIEKFDIKLKSKPKDGVILQLHHTIRGSNGECRRIRFSAGSFEDTYNRLACADNVGNLFIFDFSDLKFWKLTAVGTCTALQFSPIKSDTLVVTTAKKFEINFLNIETGSLSMSLSGHTAPIKNISFSNSKTNNLLTSSSVEAILWELTNYTKYFTLNTYLGAQIQQILFTPSGDYLVACFQNDTVQIWKHETMKSIKQIIPSELKHMKNIAFTHNGRAMAMAGLSPMLILFCMDTWKAIKSIDLMAHGISGAQQIAFIPQVFDGGANKVLAILSSDCKLHLLDIESLTITHTIYPDSSSIRKFVVSPSGKYFLCILQLGEVNIYKTSHVMDMVQECGDHVKDEPCSSTHRYIKPESHSKAEVEQKMRVCMDSARLRRILMRYGEYPDRFRSIIWKSLLDTPKNKTAYTALLDRGVHSAYKDIEKLFTIHSSITLKNLKRLLSCLAHWCPLFGVLKFLPGFVFPFVKVLQKDPLLLFECVATILLNHCQLWFEYAPFPPISILAMIENVLAEHDQQLLDHFCEIGVTSQVYALKILETSFSEILTCSEWLILWDHILSNEPAFLIMAVVAYNIIHKNSLRKIKSVDNVESFFHKQNPIAMKSFLKKIYVLLNETPEDIHPRRFFSGFISLDKGDSYQQFTGYPKATICLKLARKERKQKQYHTLTELTIKSQEKEIIERMRASEAAESKCESDAESLESDEEIRTLHKRGHDAKHGLSKKDSDSRRSGDVRQHVYKYGSKSNRSKARKRTSDRNKTNLEKEIQKLFNKYSNSDLSDA